MKKQVLIASAVVLCSIAFGSVASMAQQITNQFRQPVLVVGFPYRDIDACAAAAANKVVLDPSTFTLPPGANDLDDGYSYVPFPSDFNFTYNGQLRSGIWVSVNGFATFEGTKLVPAKQSIGLFTNSASYPDNVVAPFWGDHRLRTNADVSNGYMPSQISYVVDYDRDENCQIIQPARKCLIIQWKNLNINDASVNSSVGNFQVRLYENTQDNNYQGDVEFAYGQVGGNPNTPNTTVVTKDASVGIKGNAGFPGFLADFWNGLRWVPATNAATSQQLTSVWQPSGGRSDARIRFSAIVRFTYDNWGFGDADTSGARGARHEGLPQNRRVTANDARVIVQSIVRNEPLDSIWKRQAYQGDVNHSGRYYFTKLNRAQTADSINSAINPIPPHIVIWRRTIDVDQFTGKQVVRVYYEGEQTPPDVSSLNQIYYEVTEYDAALIMRYLSGRLPFLPWIRDNDTTGPDFGKVGDIDVADNVSFGAPVSLGNGYARVPVYVNGASRVFGAKFTVNADIVDVTAVNTDMNEVSVERGTNTAVIIGTGAFDASAPVAFVTVKEASAYTFNDIRFNEINKSSATVNGLETGSADVISTFPNPTSASASMLVNVPTNGNVTVRIFDSFGKLVATVFDGAAVAGQLSVNWNGLDASGNRVAPGAYMVRVDGAAVAAQPISVVR